MQRFQMMYNITNDSWAADSMQSEKNQIAIEHPYKITLSIHNIYKIYRERKPIIHHKLLKYIMLFEVFIALKFTKKKSKWSNCDGARKYTIDSSRLVEIYSFCECVCVCVCACVHTCECISIAWFSDKFPLIQEVLRDILSDKVSWSYTKTVHVVSQI